MKLVRSVKNLKSFRKTISGSVGFVPTMGYLHDGHLSLIRLSIRQNKNTIVSIFVNPKQFSSTKDLLKYPRDHKKDILTLQNSGVDALFLPDASEVYPEGYKTYVDVEGLSGIIEGKSRPGHFKGVATIVAKLFNLVQPTRSYFGQKDAQQVAVVKKMVRDLHIPIEIVVGPTFREPDGLAMSSRNVFLTTKERKEAVVLFDSLRLAENLFKNGERNSEKIILSMSRQIERTSGRTDYISISDVSSFENVSQINKSALVSMAVVFGKTRLIDNILLTS